MRRIDHPTAMPDLNGPGKPGFTEGDPLIALPPTRVGADVLNAWQEEIARAVELVEPLNPNDQSQLGRAIQRLARDAQANTWTKIGTVPKAAWGGAPNVHSDGGFLFGPDAAWVVEWPKLLSWREIALPGFRPEAAVTWSSFNASTGENELRAILVGYDLDDEGPIRRLAGDTVTSPSSGISTRLRSVALRLGGYPSQDAFAAGFCAVGEDGVIVTSPDGVVWTERASGTTTTLTSVSWDWQTGRWVALGPDDGVVVTSPDGVVWATGDAPAWGLGWIVQSDPGLMAWTSLDEFYRTTDGGMTWTAVERLRGSRFLVGAGFGGGRMWRHSFVGGPYVVVSHDVSFGGRYVWSPLLDANTMPWGTLIWADRIAPVVGPDLEVAGRVLAVALDGEGAAEVWLSGKGL